MRLDYGIGIVSFCPDLTARQAPSVPVGVLLVGNLVRDDQETEGGLAAVYVPHLEIEPRPDPMTREVLMSVADLLQSHVNEVVSADPAATPVGIIRALHDKLRNSLFVSSISDQKSATVSGSIHAILECVLDDAFAAALGEAGIDVGGSASSSTPPRIPDLHQVHRFERPALQVS